MSCCVCVEIEVIAVVFEVVEELAHQTRGPRTNRKEGSTTTQ